MYYQNLPLYLKLNVLLKKLYLIIHQLPKEYKFSLGHDLVNKNWLLVDLFIEAQTGTENKIKTIAIISRNFDQLKIRIRFLSELKLISLGQYTELNLITNEIGKMIGSWMKFGARVPAAKTIV